MLFYFRDFNRPISAFRPRRWKGRVVADKSKIIIKNLDINKRPISAVADNYEVRNAKKIIIKTNKNQQKNLIDTIKQNCRRIVREKTGKKPFTNINITRI